MRTARRPCSLTCAGGPVLQRRDVVPPADTARVMQARVRQDVGLTIDELQDVLLLMHEEQARLGMQARPAA